MRFGIAFAPSSSRTGRTGSRCRAAPGSLRDVPESRRPADRCAPVLGGNRRRATHASAAGLQDSVDGSTAKPWFWLVITTRPVSRSFTGWFAPCPAGAGGASAHRCRARMSRRSSAQARGRGSGCRRSAWPARGWPEHRRRGADGAADRRAKRPDNGGDRQPHPFDAGRAPDGCADQRSAHRETLAVGAAGCLTAGA